MTYGRLAQLVEHLLDVQEVTGSSPVPSTKTRASDFGQGLFCCVIHNPRQSWTVQDSNSSGGDRRLRRKQGAEAGAAF